ncbi:MAG TPA: hypothetical protein VKY65_07425 [Alphaproteobacteria bacterium]|nr:hypothetical protein [Alphaproteobacteria bacterium]
MYEIEVGQVYMKLDNIATAWEVIGGMMDGGGVRHVRLRNIKDPLLYKLISESTLRNQRFYRLLPRPSREPRLSVS